jgi:hypothetical protein
MVFNFTEKQLEQLNNWKKTIDLPENQGWIHDVKKASLEYNKIMQEADFPNGKDLDRGQIDKLFRLMKVLSANRALSRLLYDENGIERFNHHLRILLYGDESIVKKIDQFFQLKGVAEVTMSHFLCLMDPIKYSYFSWQTYQMLGIDSKQEKEALEEALSLHSVKSRSELSPSTSDYLQHWVIFGSVKDQLELENYPLVNVLLWDAYDAEGEEGGGAVGAEVEEAEREFYSPTVDWLKENWGKKILDSHNYFWTKSTAFKGRRGQPGMWSRPDITFIEVSRFEFLPQRSVQVSSFEVKRYQNADLSSVYEAASHQRWAHYAYLVIIIPEKTTPISENIDAEASRFGVGLMIAYREDSSGYVIETKAEPKRQNPDPKDLDRMIADYFSDDEKTLRRYKDVI